MWIGWGREERISYTKRTELASTKSPSMFRELQIVCCGQNVWLEGRGQQDSGRALQAVEGVWVTSCSL